MARLRNGSPPVASHQAGLAYHAVAGNQVGQGIIAHGRADGPRGGGLSNGGSQPPVSDQRTGRHPQQGLPDPHLEGRASDEGANRSVVPFRALSGERPGRPAARRPSSRANSACGQVSSRAASAVWRSAPSTNAR